jgi:hypothetical protein
MNLKNLTPLLICLLFISNAQAQVSRKMRDSEIDRMNSQSQIKELKENVLLVRLSTRQPLIDALLKSDRVADAKKIELTQLKKIKKLLQSLTSTLIIAPFISSAAIIRTTY